MQFVPVDHDPFAAAPSAPQLTPVDHDPFAAPSVLGDVATQAPIGLLSGVEQMPTLIPRALDWAGRKLEPSIESAVGYFSPSKAADMRQAAAARDAAFAGMQPKTVADMLPQPQTPAGQITRTAAEFVPGFVGAGSGGIIRDALAGAGAGAASEGAGQATAGTAAEPYARIGTAILAGAGATKALAPSVEKLTPQQVIDAAAAARKNPVVSDVQIDPKAVDGVTNIILSDLNQAKASAKIAPQTHAIVDDLRNSISGSDHTIEDFQTTRELLEKQAGNFANPQEQRAATIAIKSLDQNLRSLPPSSITAGDLPTAMGIMDKSRADFAAGYAANRVQAKLDNAALQSSAANSGANVDNAIRQQLKPILRKNVNGKQTQARGLTPDELDQIDSSIAGSMPIDALRSAGNFLKSTRGMGAATALGAAIGSGPGAAIGAGTAFAGGSALKGLGNVLAQRNANQIVQNILDRAPSAAALRPPVPPSTDPRLAALMSALLASTHYSQPWQMQSSLPQR